MKNKKLLCSVCFLFTFMSALCGQNITVKGNVTSKTDGQPIIGASVIETISTTNGTITDFDGNFTLSVPTNATLKISYIGYKPVTVKAAASIQVLLEEDTQMVDEVVVTGYTTQRKADLTGAVSVVKVDEIQKQGENNPVKALQGRVPGMNITADGNPSGTATVRIRGIGTLNNNDPLYIIDGVPSKAGMHELNGNDIESIQVLKDAASASIYGSRAANGVIIITTKQGRKGQIKINFDASVSASMYQSKLDMMNTEQYGRTLWQANVNSGKNPNANSIGYQYDWGYNAEGYPVLDNIYVPKFIDDANTIATGDTDWFDEITRTGFIQQYNLSLSNGTERGNYFFSLGYYKNDGLIKYTNFDRISARINSDYKVIDNILTIGEHFTLNRTTEVQAPGNIMSDAMIALPMIPVHTVDGTNWGGPNSTMPDRQNVARIIYDNRNNRYTYWRLFGDAYVNLNPVKGLNIRSTFGLDYAQKYQRNFTLPYNTGFLNSDKDAVEMKQEHFTKWMWNAVATYELEIGKHRGDVMAGMELNREDDINFAAYREGFAILTPDYMYPSAGVGQSQASGGAGGFSLVSFFGKLNYSYADKYLLSFTLRRDGSSRFGSNNKYATFPSVSLGWRISQEAFMEKTKDVIDDLKIRAAWGQTGNQDIENYARYSIYESKYGTGNPPTYGTSYDITGSNGGSLLPSGFVRTQIGNDDIKWETTTQTNVGMDFSLFNQTLYGSAEYYYKKTTDILIKPSYIGTGIGIVGIYLSHRQKGVLLPNFILYIATGVLSLLSLAALIPGDYVPPGALPLTLEVGILIPMLSLYMHKRRFINYFLRQIGACKKRLYAQGAEAAVVSARIVLIFGILHFIIISITVILQSPLSKTSLFVLYKILPPTVFIMSILFNQIAIRFFNHLIAHTEYVPIVNTKGDVIGKTPAIEAINYKNTYINPVIRIAVSTHGMLFLCDRPSTAILDKNKVDVPMECYLRYGESLAEGANRLISNAIPQAKDIKPEFNIVYHFENEVTNRLIYLFIIDLEDDSVLCTPRFKNSKLWNFKQIEENLGKGFFSCCFEDEYEHLKNVIYIREKYKES